MAKARAIVKRRKAVQNIRKITRTMELIATARFKKALNRATEAEAYTRKIAELVADLGATGAGGRRTRSWRSATRSRSRSCWSSRATEGWPAATTATSSERPPGSLPGQPDRRDRRPRSKSPASAGSTTSGSASWPPDATYTQFEDRPQFDEVEVLADKYIEHVRPGRDRPARRRLHPVHHRRRGRRRSSRPCCRSTAERRPGGPVGSPGRSRPRGGRPTAGARPSRSRTSSCPTPQSILEEIVPGLVQGPAVQVLPRRGRQRADRADGRHGGGDRERRRHVKSSTRQYNRARQAQITRELAEIIGGAAALE